ncbi:hypothetical protein [Agromyces bauzanensis]
MTDLQESTAAFIGQIQATFGGIAIFALVVAVATLVCGYFSISWGATQGLSRLLYRIGIVALFVAAVCGVLVLVTGKMAADALNPERLLPY